MLRLSRIYLSGKARSRLAPFLRSSRSQRNITQSRRHFTIESFQENHAAATRDVSKAALESLTSIALDTTNQLVLPEYLMQNCLLELQSAPERYKEYAAVAKSILDRTAPSDKHFHLPQLVCECCRAAFRKNDPKTFIALWNQAKELLPGRALEPDVYAMRAILMYTDKKAKAAFPLMEDACRRFSKLPHRLTEPLTMFLQQLAISKDKFGFEDAVQMMRSYFVPLSASTYAVLISMAPNYEEVLKLEQEMRATEIQGPPASVSSVCALLRAAGAAKRVDEVNRIKNDYEPIIKKIYSQDAAALSKAMADINSSFLKIMKRMQPNA